MPCGENHQFPTACLSIVSFGAPDIQAAQRPKGSAETEAMSSSVFVRNLPYGITQEELEQIFSDIGPVKKVDVIKDKGKKKSDMLTRGFAFVKLYVPVDAAVLLLLYAG